MTDLNVLFIEDFENDALLLLHELQRGGYEVQWKRVETESALESALASESWDLILCDYSMPSLRTAEVLEVMRRNDLDLPFIIVSGSVNEEEAISALHAGAHDFLSKNNLARLLPAVQRELQQAKNRRKHKQLDDILRASELRFRNTIENMMEGCQILGHDWRYLYLNATAEKHNHRPNQELLGKVYMEMWPGIESTAVFAALERCMSQRVASHMINEFTYPDGLKGWFELDIQPVPEGIFILSNDITNRKKSEQAILEREMKLSMLLDILPVGISILDAERKVTYTNPALKRILDISEEQLLRGDYKDRRYIRADGSSMPHDELPSAQILKGKKEVNDFETGVVKEHGGVVWTSVSAVPVDFPDWRVVIVTSDITERKKMEQANAYLAAVVESSHDAIISKDLTGIVTSWNLGAEKVFGYTADEIIGQPILRLIPEHLRMDEEKILARIGQGQAIDHFETVRVAKDGRHVEVSISLSSIKDAAGRIIGASKVARDITERKNAEERFRLAIESAPNAIIMVDQQGQIVMVNSQTEKYFGYERGELLVMKVEELVPAHFRGGHANHRDGYHSQPQPRAMGTGRDLYGLRKDGSEFPIEIGLAPINAHQGILILATIVDITARKRAQEEILKLNTELELKVSERTAELALANEQLKQLSLFDQLTGLYNRHGFLLLAEAQLVLAKRTRRNLLVFYADLDDLKQINDNHGHMAGDQAIVAAARALQQAFRTSDIKARLGGDEFVVLVVDAEGGDAKALLARLFECLEEYHQSMSVGVVTWDSQMDLSMDELIAQADLAMYKEKRKRRGRHEA